MFGRRKRTKPTSLRSLDELTPMLESGRPVLIDFYRFGCASCKVMDGIVNELADEYRDSAHVVKVNVAHVPGAVQSFGIRATPTFVVLGGAPTKKASRKRRRPESPRGRSAVTPRWRASGLVKKDALARVLESNGARPAD